MGVRLGSIYSKTILASPAAAAETVICTTGPINLFTDGAQVLLCWFLDLTIGTNGTGLAIRLRRGTAITDTVLNIAINATVVAANVVRHSGCYFDSPPNVAEQQYSLTAQVNLGSAPSTINDVCLAVMVL
jgi:hypothetical protein